MGDGSWELGIICEKYFIELNLLFFIISQKNKFKKNIMKTTKISLLILLIGIFTFSVQSCKKATKEDNSDDCSKTLEKFPGFGNPGGSRTVEGSQ